MKILIRLLGCLIAVTVLTWLIRKGYQLNWSGFQGYLTSKGEYVPPKKLWDWLQLLIVPAFLAIAVWLLNKSQKESDQLVETDRQRQKALEDYFVCMQGLLLDKSLRTTAATEARSIARTRTLVLMSTLDADRKGQALQFLYESRLIDKTPIIQMTGADLRGAKLAGATLQGVELRGVFLCGADLRGANLENSDLRGSDFTGSDLRDVKATGANLTQAILEQGRNASLLGHCQLNTNP